MLVHAPQTRYAVILLNLDRPHQEKRINLHCWSLGIADSKYFTLGKITVKYSVFMGNNSW